MKNAAKLLNTFNLARYRLLEIIAELLSFFYVRMYLIIIIGLNLLNWLFVYIINLNISQDLVVLHYNVDFGVNLIGSVKQVYVIPMLGLIIIIINLILLAFYFRQDYRHSFKENTVGEEDRGLAIPFGAGKFIAHLLLSGALLVNIFLFIAITSVYLVNFYR